jgi:hypothetical protein
MPAKVKTLAAPRKRGQQSHVPQPEQRQLVQALVASGTVHSYIAIRLKISVSTLSRHYREELDTGLDAANAMVANKVFAMAMAGNVACMFFWMKCRGGWRETAALELSGPGGAPIAIEEKGYDLSRLSLAEQLQMEELMLKVALPASVVVYDNSAS